MHRESISIVEVEGEPDEVEGGRGHSIEEISHEGRSGGGYVVGNAYGGVETTDRGHVFYSAVNLCA